MASTRRAWVVECAMATGWLQQRADRVRRLDWGIGWVAASAETASQRVIDGCVIERMFAAVCVFLCVAFPCRSVPLRSAPLRCCVLLPLVRQPPSR